MSLLREPSCPSWFRDLITLRARAGSRGILSRSVADVAEVVDADLAGEEAVGGELAQECEELDSLAEAGIFLEVLAVGDLVENFFLLRRACNRDTACRSDRGRCCRAT